MNQNPVIIQDNGRDIKRDRMNAPHNGIKWTWSVPSDWMRQNSIPLIPARDEVHLDVPGDKQRALSCRHERWGTTKAVCQDALAGVRRGSSQEKVPDADALER